MAATTAANATVGAAGSAANDLLEGKQPSAGKMVTAAVANGSLSLIAGLRGAKSMLSEKMSAASPMTPQGIGDYIVRTTQEVSGGGVAMQGAASTAGRFVDLAREAGVTAAQKKVEEKIE